MSLINKVFVVAFSFVILAFFVRQARGMNAPPIFIAVAALMAVMILVNLGRSILRGY